jgi:hypothetical protein
VVARAQAALAEIATRRNADTAREEADADEAAQREEPARRRSRTVLPRDAERDHDNDLVRDL